MIDKKSQKIEINPGVPYVSTSQDAVFELRRERDARLIGKQQNNYIAIPPSKFDEEEESDCENVYIRPKESPY